MMFLSKSLAPKLSKSTCLLVGVVRHGFQDLYEQL